MLRKKQREKESVFTDRYSLVLWFSLALAINKVLYKFQICNFVYLMEIAGRPYFEISLDVYGISEFIIFYDQNLFFNNLLFPLVHLKSIWTVQNMLLGRWIFFNFIYYV